MATDPMWVFENYAFAAAAIDELEDEIAKLRAGQEPVAFKKPSLLMDCNVRYSTSTTPQPSAVPDAIATAIREFEKSGWHGSKGYHARLLKAASIAEEYATPSAPATVQGVNQQLLEALTDSLELMETLCAFEGDTIRKARAAIAAAQQEDGKV